MIAICQFSNYLIFANDVVLSIIMHFVDISYAWKARSQKLQRGTCHQVWGDRVLTVTVSVLYRRYSSLIQ